MMFASSKNALACSILAALCLGSPSALLAATAPSQPLASAAGTSAVGPQSTAPATTPRSKQATTAAPKVTQLKSITVTSPFIAKAGHSALKMDVQARDTPFSISTYTGSFIHAIEAAQVNTLYPYMTGVQAAGNTGDDLVFRGFTSSVNDQNSILVDGLPGLATRFGSPVTIGISRIDVVRGPASVLNGEEQPGGFVNLITKKPEADPLYEFSASGTTYDGSGIGLTDKLGGDFAADLTGPLGHSDRLLYRLVMDDANGDTFRNNSYSHSIYFAPSLTWNVSDNTSLTAQYVFQRLKYSYDTELVAPNNNIALVAPIITRYQQPSDEEHEYGSVLTLLFNHQFANGISWSLDTRNVWHTDDAHGYDVASILKNLQYVGLRARGQLNKRRYDYLDTNLHIPFNTFGIQHNLVVGLTDGRDVADLNRTQFYNAPSTGPNALTMSIYDPVYGLAPELSSLPLYAPGNASVLTHRFTTTYSYGTYFADMMTLSSHWKATLGLRYSHDRQAIEELRVAGVPSSNKANSKVLPMAGLIYQPNEHWSNYISYSTSYVPPSANAIDINGVNNFVPTSADQVEAGSKVNFLDNHVSATLAVFRINEKNTLSSFKCADYGTCYTQVGKARSQGAELEVNARPLPNWQLTAGYAFTAAQITSSTNPAQVDTRLPNAPEHSAHLWSRYDFRSSSLQGLGFGVGVIRSGERAGLTPTAVNQPVLQLPAYTRVDAALYYNRDQYALTLKVENLFNKIYYQSSSSNLAVLPGNPRLITLSARFFFE